MRAVVRGWKGACITGVFGLLSAQAQQAGIMPSLPERDRVPDLISAISPFLIPKVVADGHRLKEFVTSEEFASARKENGDLYAVDLLFDTALRWSWNNPYEALLITFVAVMDHRTFGVRLPLVGELLWFPLTSEFPEEFTARVAALPGKLFPDSPEGGGGDRDKLQHFFGSAFLTYATESTNAAERAGVFVEWGEREFIVGGVYDERDLQANRKGQRFAMRLLVDPAARPSASILDAPPETGPIRKARPDSLHVHLEAP